MNNKPLTPKKPAELTEEQKKEQALRAFIQKRNAIAEALLINEARQMRVTKANVAEVLSIAEEFMSQAYGVTAEKK